MTPDLWPKNDQKVRGLLPEKLGGDVRHASWNPYPTSDQNLWFFLPRSPSFDGLLSYPISDLIKNLIPYFRTEVLEPGAWQAVDCKTVRIFVYSSTCEQLNKRSGKSGTSLKTESETGERRRETVFFLSPHTPVGCVRLARFAHARLLGHALPIFLLILIEKPTVLQSRQAVAARTL